MRRYELIVDVCGRPMTHNSETRLHRQQVAKGRKVWREAGCVLARQARIPKMPRVAVECWGRYPTRTMPDVDAVAPTLKAVLDGIVDAGVLVDDKPPYVVTVTYWEPVHAPGLPPALVVRLTEVETFVHPAKAPA